jgi:SAM-dependent methyltransferase
MSDAHGLTTDVAERARQSGGTSADAIYRMVARAIASRHTGGGTLVDVGCGSGNLWPMVRCLVDRYVGTDLHRYPGFPETVDFVQSDLDRGIPLPDGTGDVVVAVETIEHLETPWAFARELVRLAKPGAWVVISTPNQLSALSLATLIAKHRFSAFQDVHYPMHRTALLEVDLTRIASASGLTDLAIAYSHSGRVVFTSWRYPTLLSRLFPRRLSDNLVVVGRKPAA